MTVIIAIRARNWFASFGASSGSTTGRNELPLRHDRHTETRQDEAGTSSTFSEHTARVAAGRKAM